VADLLRLVEGKSPSSSSGSSSSLGSSGSSSLPLPAGAGSSTGLKATVVQAAAGDSEKIHVL
jgi:hypothetical protein